MSGGRETELERANEKGFDCGSGSYCSVQQSTQVPDGRTDPRGARPTRERTTPIFHRTKTTISDGKATTDLYIISDNNRWVIAARTTDGGKTYFFSEETRPNGTKIVGDGVRQSLAAGGDMNKQVKAQVTNTLKGGGGTDEQRLSDEQIRQTGAVDSNTATDSERSAQEGGNVPSLTQEEWISLSNEQIGTKQDANSFKDWRYPLSMNAKRDEKNKQDVIIFTMKEYTAPAGLDNLSGGTLKGRKKQEGTRLGTVILPIQPTITDSNLVTWQQDSLDPFLLAGLELSSSTIDRGVDGATDAINNIIRTLGTENKNIGKAVQAAAAGAAIGRNVLARTTGAILNPNIELLFNAPSLRVFNYRFQLSARDENDSKQIQGIIRFFKKGMAVRRTEAELFLVTPNIFDIRYLFKEGNDHPYINRIKTCALTNCSVDYTPTGSYMTFPDGAMVSYAINLTFEELEPIYQDDYEKDGEIGF
jgi:hypothetical protein